MSTQPAFKAFLSHRYKSPEVNEYFFDAFGDRATIVFDVDAATGATNITRLERLVRSSDGFIGIYPFVPERTDAPIPDQLQEASRYFRLEMGLAARARKPMLIYADQDFGEKLAPPAVAQYVEFDGDEVRCAGASPNRKTFGEAFDRFLERVKAGQLYDGTQAKQWRTNRVGVLLPPESGYTPAIASGLSSRLDAAGADPHLLEWPDHIGTRFLAAIDACDWIVTDVGSRQETSAVVAFLEGRFIPLARLASRPADAPAQPMPIEAVLYGCYEAGFPKDILRWSAEPDLFDGFAQRLARIGQKPKRIGTADEARAYFRSAALRKERVFISYCGTDAEAGARLADTFRRRFQQVFDYRDGNQSIRGGQPWLDEIFNSLGQSALAILLVSPAYVASGNCTHEAEAAIAQRDGKKLALLPVRLGSDSIEMPPWLGNLQYVKWSGTEDPARVLEQALALLPTP